MMKDSSCCQGLRWGESEHEEHVSPGICDPVGYSPWGRKKSDMIERLTLFFFFILIKGGT